MQFLKKYFLYVLFLFNTISPGDQSDTLDFKKFPLEIQEKVISHLPVADIKKFRLLDRYFLSSFDDTFIFNDKIFAKIIDSDFKNICNVQSDMMAEIYEAKMFLESKDSPMQYFSHYLYENKDKSFERVTAYDLKIPEGLKKRLKKIPSLNAARFLERTIFKLNLYFYERDHPYNYMCTLVKDLVSKSQGKFFYCEHKIESHEVSYIKDAVDECLDINPFEFIFKKSEGYYANSGKSIYSYKNLVVTYLEEQKHFKVIALDYLKNMFQRFHPSSKQKNDVIKTLIEKNYSKEIIFELLQDESYISDEIIKSAAANSLEVLQYLVQEKNIDLTKSCDKYGFTPLLVAACYKKLDILEYLIDLDPQLLHARNVNGKSALDFLLDRRAFDVIKSILDKKLAVNEGLSLESVLSATVKTSLKSVLETRIKISSLELQENISFLNYWFDRYTVFSKGEKEIICKSFKELFRDFNCNYSRNNEIFNLYIQFFYENLKDVLDKELDKSWCKLLYEAFLCKCDIDKYDNNFDILKMLLSFDVLCTDENCNKLFIAACAKKNYDLMRHLLQNYKIDFSFCMSFKMKEKDYINHNAFLISIRLQDLELFYFLVDNCTESAQVLFNQFEYRISKNSRVENYLDILDYIILNSLNINDERHVDDFFCPIVEKILSYDVPEKNLKNFLKKSINDKRPKLSKILLEKIDLAHFNDHQIIKRCFTHPKFLEELFNKDLVFDASFIEYIPIDEKLISIISLLLDRGLDINKKLSDGDTILIKVIKNVKSLDIMYQNLDFLIQNGASPETRSSEGKTAFRIFNEIISNDKADTARNLKIIAIKKILKVENDDEESSFKIEQAKTTAKDASEDLENKSTQLAEKSEKSRGDKTKTAKIKIKNKLEDKIEKIKKRLKKNNSNKYRFLESMKQGAIVGIGIGGALSVFAIAYLLKNFIQSISHREDVDNSEQKVIY